jgi:hypothetical protein
MTTKKRELSDLLSDRNNKAFAALTSASKEVAESLKSFGDSITDHSVSDDELLKAKWINAMDTSCKSLAKFDSAVKKSERPSETFIESTPLGKSVDLINKFIDNNPHKRQSELPHPEVGIASTPLIRSVKHLLKIGSTDKAELEQMAAEFITEKMACEKLGFSYYDWQWNNFHGDYLEAQSTKQIIKVIIRQDIYDDLMQSNFISTHYKIVGSDHFVFGIEILITKGTNYWLFEESR